MTHSDLERELRDHYSHLDPGAPSRAATRVADALDRAPAHRWSLGRLVSARAALTAGAAVAVVAALTVALLPLWHGSSTVTGVGGESPTPGASTYASGTASPSVIANPNESPTATRSLAPSEVSLAGMGQNGILWAVRGSELDISMDHGRTWGQSTLPQDALPGSTVQSVAVADATHAWVVMTTNPAAGAPIPPASTTAVIYTTADGGAIWQISKARTLDGNVVAQLIFVDARVGFAILTPQTNAGVGASTVMRTLDGGITWAVTGTSANVGYAIWATDQNTIWMTAASSTPGGGAPLQVSRDGGATWSAVSLPGIGDTPDLGTDVMSAPFGGFKFLTADEGYLSVLHVTGGNFETRYYKTADGGRTWSLTATYAAMVISSPAFVDATHWYQLKPDSSVMETSADGGRTWTAVGNIDVPGAKVFAVYMADAQNGVAVGTGDASSQWILGLTWDGGKTWQAADFSAR